MAKYNRFGLALLFGVLVALLVGLPVTAGVTQHGEDSTHIEQLDVVSLLRPLTTGVDPYLFVTKEG